MRASVQAATMVILAGLALAACGRSDPGTYIASAQSYIAKAEYRAAIIQLRNAIKDKPENAEARFLLAKSLLAVGDASGAQSDPTAAIRWSGVRS